jgi:hypothetical protein
MKHDTNDIIRGIRSVTGGALDILECYAGDFVPAPQLFRMRELSFDIEQDGAWRPLPFQVERWQGKLFDARASTPGNDERLLPNDRIVMDTSTLTWQDGVSNVSRYTDMGYRRSLNRRTLRTYRATKKNMSCVSKTLSI